MNDDIYISLFSIKILLVDNKKIYDFREDVRDTLRILVATDCHLGYMEKDEIRRHDSFKAFEEICSIAAQKQVMFFSFSFFFDLLVVSLLCIHTSNLMFPIASYSLSG